MKVQYGDMRRKLVLHLFALVLFVVSLVSLAFDVGSMHVVGDELETVAGGGEWRGVLVEDVDLLEGKTLGL